MIYVDLTVLLRLPGGRRYLYLMLTYCVVCFNPYIHAIRISLSVELNGCATVLGQDDLRLGRRADDASSRGEYGEALFAWPKPISNASNTCEHLIRVGCLECVSPISSSGNPEFNCRVSTVCRGLSNGSYECVPSPAANRMSGRKSKQAGLRH